MLSRDAHVARHNLLPVLLQNLLQRCCWCSCSAAY